MQNEEKIREEISRSLDRLSAMDPKSDDYAAILKHANSLQDMLDNETMRINSNIELKAREKQMDLDSEKVAIEAEKLEFAKEQEANQIKKDRKGRVWSVALEIVKGIIGVVGGLAVIAGSVAVNNAGEILPKGAEKYIFKKF